jgi:hypothetical protein
LALHAGIEIVKQPDANVVTRFFWNRAFKRTCRQDFQITPLAEALCRLVWNLTSQTAVDKDVVLWHGRHQRILWQVLELGHTQIGNGNKVGCRPETSRRSLGLLQQAVHALHISIAAVIEHAAHHTVELRLQSLGQLLERLRTSFSNIAPKMLPATMPILRALLEHGSSLANVSCRGLWPCVVTQPVENAAQMAAMANLVGARGAKLNRRHPYAGCWMLDAGCWMLDAGCWMLDAGCWMLQDHAVPPLFNVFAHLIYDHMFPLWNLAVRAQRAGAYYAAS